MSLWSKIWPPLVGVALGLGVLTAVADVTAEPGEKCEPEVVLVHQEDGYMEAELTTCDGREYRYRTFVAVCPLRL